MLRQFIFTFILLVLAPTGFASTINVETCPVETEFSCITAINNLEVNGAFYDVTVQQTTLNTLFDNSDFFYWGDSLWANAAMNSIITTLNSISPNPTSDDTKFIEGVGESILHLPFEYSGNGVDFNSWCVQLVNVGSVGGGNCTGWAPDETFAFATFSSTSTVPIPSAFWLFSTGLLGLIKVARKKRTMNSDQVNL